MFKNLVFLFTTFSLLNGSILTDKITKIIGKEDFLYNRGLIDHLFTNEVYFFRNGNINYILALEELKKHGLIKLSFGEPKDMLITFSLNKDPIKSLKIVSDSLKSLGYYHYFTKKMTYGENDKLTWTITLKTEAAIDPLLLSKELFKNGSHVIDIKKEGLTNWIYEIDTTNSIIYDSQDILVGEKVELKKPLRPYFLRIEESKNLQIYSKNGNDWFPNIVFYDKHLNILQIVKRDYKNKRIDLTIPEKTEYIKIDDIYTLSNLNRGLIVTIKE